MQTAGMVLGFAMLAWVVSLTLYMLYVTTLDVIEDIQRRWSWRRNGR